MAAEKPIQISQHARLQMVERGVTETEVVSTIRQGDAEPARAGRTMYRKTFEFRSTWRGRTYRLKQVAAVVANDPDKIVVVTVFSFYF